jgi:hypothetical protein
MKTSIFLPIVSLMLFLLTSCQKSDLQNPNAHQFDIEQYNNSHKVLSKKKDLTIGDFYGGGMVISIDESGKHGLIIATEDIGNVPWGCYGTSIPGISTDAGTGQANTNAILTYCNEPGIAARICDEYVAWEKPEKSSQGKSESREYNNINSRSVWNKLHIDTENKEECNKEKEGWGKKYDDWYLPSLGDWQVIAHAMSQISNPNPNFFSGGGYWCSSQGSGSWQARPVLESETAYIITVFSYGVAPDINFGLLISPHSKLFTPNVRPIRAF